MIALKRIFAVLLCVLLLAACGRISEGDRLAERGYEEYAAHRYENALGYFERAESSGLKSTSVTRFYSCYGDALFRMERYSESITAHMKALAVNDRLFSSWVTVGICERRLGDLGAAERAYSRAVECDPHDSRSVGLYLSMGSMFISNGRPYAALSYLRKAEEIYPEHPAAHAYMAIAYAMTGDHSRSAEELQLAAAYGYHHIYEVRETIININNSAAVS